MKQRIIAIDQSTSATKALVFDESLRQLDRSSREHRQYYPQAGQVEHDAEEIYRNTIAVVSELAGRLDKDADCSIALTNQRETVVVWNRHTGRPVANAIVWQDTRGAEQCRQLREAGHSGMVQEKSGLKIDPNFSASAVSWLLDNVPGTREAAESGDLCMGTVDCWLVWKLTEGRVFATDYTNASRTMLFNIHTMDWDDDLLALFGIPRAMMPALMPCDAVYGETTAEGAFLSPVPIAGVLGDSHGALAGQMCFKAGCGKVTYGTGSSVMVNIGESPLPAPEGLVTSVGFTALGKTFFGFEGNIYSTGATIKWMTDNLSLIGSPAEAETVAREVPDNGGVYLIPAFSGLGAPWWADKARGAIVGMTFNTRRAHIVRAAIESIAFQVKDLIDAMTAGSGMRLEDICADGGPTKNRLLMQLQADLLDTPVVTTEVEDASALGAAVMNGFARGLWHSFDEVSRFRKVTGETRPGDTAAARSVYDGWLAAVRHLIN